MFSRALNTRHSTDIAMIEFINNSNLEKTEPPPSSPAGHYKTSEWDISMDIFGNLAVYYCR